MVMKFNFDHGGKKVCWGRSGFERNFGGLFID
jgi:hypothetical protein